MIYNIILAQIGATLNRVTPIKHIIYFIFFNQYLKNSLLNQLILPSLLD